LIRFMVSPHTVYHTASRETFIVMSEDNPSKYGKMRPKDTMSI
jgi:hypothetical protein